MALTKFPNINNNMARTPTVNQELAQQTRLPLAILCRPYASPEEGEVRACIRLLPASLFYLFPFCLLCLFVHVM
jgi:hypothetical protein